MNTGLDLFLVGYCKLGIRGAAIATIISQGVSAVLVLAVLTRDRGACRLDWRAIRVDGTALRRICAVGLPVAIQDAILSFSNVFVQSYVNRFGAAAMAAWTSYGKIEALALQPISAITTANTVFTSQNLGAGSSDRVKKGARCTFLIGMTVTVCILVPVLLLAPQLIGLFNRDTEVLRIGTQVVHAMVPFYVVCVVDNVYRSTLNGAGVTKITMIATLGGYVVFRQAYLLLAQRLIGSFTAVVLGYPLGWTACSLALCLYYHLAKWEKS